MYGRFEINPKNKKLVVSLNFRASLETSFHLKEAVERKIPEL